MKLLIDSGATKTDFFLKTKNHEVLQFQSDGINVNYVDDNYIESQFNIFINQLHEFDYKDINKIRYYGAGCLNKSNANRVYQILTQLFPHTKIEVYSDLIAVCHALLDDQPGYVGILGTGAASCFYDGTEIVDRAPSLGYLLGDEGSGSHLGKIFLTSYLKEEISKPISSEFESFFNLSRDLFIPKLYYENQPQKFLSSIPPFLYENIDKKEVFSFVFQSFNEYFLNQKNYYKREEICWNMSGSVAYYFADILQQAASFNHMTISKIIKSPLIELIDKF